LVFIIIYNDINQEEQGKDIKISVLDAILMISDEWTYVFITTIRKCFHNAGFKASVNDKIEVFDLNYYIYDMCIIIIIMVEAYLNVLTVTAPQRVDITS